ncbi:LacI family DNA-binding transcriptional regulator [Nocardioides sp. Kera G14]|uniref:LacI family DNA-binding transcriptional regulator n=1 Tax=Nocardioides sp. Kera G14 TaxID=2884264 RepID=UPI001D0FFB03|nr:LacI family DNA-binding transcriptional regulator [Nocardioides sp. Kera G14]UDY23685.1 LacI family transcriptional regulator [Nocardioides sp. Kera G14]
MTTRRVTLADVAKAAGVSRSTASEALSGRGRMAEQTRAGVREAAAQLGYRPNALARGLRTGRTYSIGLHQLAGADSFATQYVRDFVGGVMLVAKERDYDLMFLSAHPDKPRPSQPQVDGILIADPIADDIRARELLDSGVPIVAAEQFPEGMASAPVIRIDHVAVLHRLLDHCFTTGVRRPLLVVPDANSGWGAIVRSAYVDWCLSHDIEPVHVPIAFLTGFEEDERELMSQLMTVRPDADLVIVPTEHAALAVVSSLRERGVALGSDVQVACLIEAELLSHLSTAVTAIDLNPRELGAACASALIDHLEAGAPLPDLTLIDGGLHLRASTAGL